MEHRGSNLEGKILVNKKEGNLEEELDICSGVINFPENTEMSVLKTEREGLN